MSVAIRVHYEYVKVTPMFSFEIAQNSVIFGPIYTMEGGAHYSIITLFGI